MSDTGKVSYSSNNSGGGWWLDDDDWHALAEAGWDVEWAADMDEKWHDGNGRWLGALAYKASKRFPNLRDGIEEWERITHMFAASLGCSCCGPPHNFTWEGDDGSRKYASPRQPEYGEMDY